MHKRDQVRRMQPRDWLAPPKDKPERSGAARAMRSAWIVPILQRQRLPPRTLVRGQRSTGVQGETLEIEIEVERERAQDAAQRDRKTGRHHLLETVTFARIILCIAENART